LFESRSKGLTSYHNYVCEKDFCYFIIIITNIIIIIIIIIFIFFIFLLLLLLLLNVLLVKITYTKRKVLLTNWCIIDVFTVTAK